MRDFENKRSSTSGWDEKAAAAGPGPGKRTLTEMLPASPSVQRKIEAPVMPTGARTIDDLFGGVQRVAVDGPSPPVQRNARGIPFLQLGPGADPTALHHGAGIHSASSPGQRWPGQR